LVKNNCKFQHKLFYRHSEQHFKGKSAAKDLPKK